MAWMKHPEDHRSPEHEAQRRQIMSEGVVPYLKEGQVAILFISDPSGHVHYISNGERQSVRTAMKAILKRWDKDYAQDN